MLLFCERHSRFVFSDEKGIGEYHCHSLFRDAREVEKLKKDLSLKNMDALMEYLLSLPRDPVPEVVEEDDSGNEWEAPGKKRKKNVRPPLYSMIALAERPDMLKFYTGFNLETIELLIRTLEEVGRLTLLFFSFSFPRAHGTCFIFGPVFLIAHDRPWIGMLQIDEKATRGSGRWT